MQEVKQCNNLEIGLNFNQTVNYVAVINGEQVFRSLTVKNTGARVMNNLTLKVSGYYFPDTEFAIPSVGPGKTVAVEAVRIMPSIDRLVSLSESVYTELTVSVSNRSRELLTFRLPITIQAWNQWRALPEDYASVASFVLPHHEYVAEIISKAATILNINCPGATMSGYDCRDFELLMYQVVAVWEALTEENFNYLTMVFDYCEGGQKIQTPDMMRRHRQGNCMDMSVLLCACLERLNLQPLLVFVPGHVMVGLWLSPAFSLPDATCTDTRQLLKYITDKKRRPEMLLIEATAMRDSTTLEEACRSAMEILKTHKPDLAVDIAQARMLEKIEPLPIYRSSAEIVPCEWTEINGCRKGAAGSTRRDGWERKLLDLTLRNPMLNLTSGKTILPLWEKDVREIVIQLKANRLTELVGKQGEDPAEKLKNLYRAARTSLEENGANSLFVAVGTMKWYDVDDDRPHLAPLLFIPATVVRKKAMTYEIRLRDDEPMVNVTLIEMLRQMFGVTFPELENIPLDEDGFPDWQRIFAIFAEHVREINKRQPAERQWELPVESYVGIFSFTKYLMWHDIHSHPAVLDRHPVIAGLMDNRYTDRSEHTDARKLEAALPTALMLPIPYDSSQLEAVADAQAGGSFVLHGPPGTGKSQTITNMIANAIFQGKRVLFVAEKKAALDVVRTRLAEIGLLPYCLELHSNKTDKRSFFGQLADSRIDQLGTGIEAGLPSRWYATGEALQRYRTTLDGVTEAIHMSRDHGVSLYDCLCKFLAKSYGRLPLRYEEVKHLSPDEITALCAELSSLDLVAQMLGFHPGESRLVGLYPRENTADNQRELTSTVESLPRQIERVRRKATGLINRLFRRKSAEEILQADPVWQKLTSLAIVDPDATGDIDSIERNVNRWKEAIGELRRWYYFSDKVGLIDGYDLPAALSHYLAGETGERTAADVEGGYYHALADNVIGNDPRLRGFSGKLHDTPLTRYLETVESFRTQTSEALLMAMDNRVRSNRLDNVHRKQLALLNRRILSNGRAVSLRRVISESESVLQMIFPCMLMSPLSVAQYLDMRPEMFDLVIFDEASQMETPDAIGAIARGNNLVVVGDPQQLPPTRFFTTRAGGGEETEESEDADSILEDCIAVGLPSRYLSRHYRSRHESLIAFSNARFYDNRLLTFPSSNDAERKVRLIDPQGVYDSGKTRTNRIEAEAVVDYIVSLLKDREDAPSIGVVAFSKAQSNLIEDLLNSRLQRSKPMQNKLDEAYEPIFIKNLENVQGDERDVIIFSIGYGPDKNGNVSLNFGPLNQSGGERRLNVAVSRAREEMVVFSSLQARHIPDERSIAKGVTALRQFLMFASGDSAADESATATARKDALIDDIAARLRERGVDLRTHVGRSSFRVDLAVVDPANPDRYALGIIIDGRDYHRLPTVRDREVTVPGVLRSLGWKLHRVWVIDWLENPEAVIISILDALKP